MAVKEPTTACNTPVADRARQMGQGGVRIGHAVVVALPICNIYSIFCLFCYIYLRRSQIKYNKKKKGGDRLGRDRRREEKRTCLVGIRSGLSTS